jgi:hypothetical protein
VLVAGWGGAGGGGRGGGGGGPGRQVYAHVGWHLISSTVAASLMWTGSRGWTGAGGSYDWY